MLRLQACVRAPVGSAGDAVVHHTVSALPMRMLHRRVHDERAALDETHASPHAPSATVRHEPRVDSACSLAQLGMPHQIVPSASHADRRSPPSPPSATRNCFLASLRARALAFAGLGSG